MFSLRIDFDLFDKLESKVKEGKFKNVSEAIRKNMELGLFVDNLKPNIKDPVFLKSMEDIRRNDSIFDWLGALTDEQINAIYTAAAMEKEKRINQGRH